MSTAARPKPTSPAPHSAPTSADRTVADLLRSLGNIPAHRVRLHPAPGTATVRDVLHIIDREGRLCELIDGTLVEKTMGFEESEIALWIGTLLNNFVRPRRLGIVTGPDGTIRLLPNQVRLPDVAYFARARLPGRRRPKGPIPAIHPELAVEVLSKSNTRQEVTRKLREYFTAGTRLVWIVDPKRHTVRVHTDPKTFTTRTADQDLDGGDVLPGFAARVRDLFPAD
jgi:Uma2 family endonuclease